MALVL
jgi:hypothetical protein